MAGEPDNVHTIEDLESKLQALHAEKSEASDEMESLRQTVETLEAQLKAAADEAGSGGLADTVRELEAQLEALRSKKGAGDADAAVAQMKAELNCIHEIQERAGMDVESMAEAMESFEIQVAELHRDREELERALTHSQGRLEKVANLVGNLVAGSIMD